jgi:hypothetical protein
MAAKKTIISIALIAMIAVASIPSLSFAWNNSYGLLNGGFGFNNSFGDFLLLSALLNNGSIFGGSTIGGSLGLNSIGSFIILDQLLGNGNLFSFGI